MRNFAISSFPPEQAIVNAVSPPLHKIRGTKKIIIEQKYVCLISRVTLDSPRSTRISWRGEPPNTQQCRCDPSPRPASQGSCLAEKYGENHNYSVIVLSFNGQKYETLETEFTSAPYSFNNFTTSNCPNSAAIIIASLPN